MTIVDLPLDSTTAVARPEQVIVRFPTGKTVDVGSLCYERSGDIDYRRKFFGRGVRPDSLDIRRVPYVRDLIRQISDYVSGGDRAETTRAKVVRYIAFLRWLDEQGQFATINDPHNMIELLGLYLSTIRERVRRNELTLNAGAAQQRAVVDIFSRFTGMESIHRKLQLLCPAQDKRTAMPDVESQGRVLSLSTLLFQGLSDLVLKALPYPHAIKIPPYLERPDNLLWTFPTTTWFKPDASLAPLERPSAMYNYDEGRLATLDEIARIWSSSPQLALRTGAKQLAAANGDPQHSARRKASSTAANLYFLIFLAATGMNLAQAESLTWSEDFSTHATHQGFRTIKWRAGGKSVSFELPAGSLGAFKRYLEIRRYLLGEHDYAHLFFSLSGGHKGRPCGFKNPLKRVYCMLRRMTPEVPVIQARQWRAAKSDWLLRHTDPSTTALVLQNSERTVLASYAEGSESDQQRELGQFLTGVTAAVNPAIPAIGSLTVRSLGACTSYGEPSATTGAAPLHPDCKQIEGCLFCDKFRVHADETDIRKLLSCRHCITWSRQRMPLSAGQDNTLAMVVHRIDALTVELSKRDERLVARIAKEVDENGELDAFWATKLELMMHVEELL